MYAGAGADQLSGGDGNDNLYGQAGNDELDGEGGNDYLIGGEGDDIYRWGRGQGNDTISDYDSVDRTNSSHIDRLIFDEGVSLSDLSWKRSSNDLVFTINDTGENIRISSYFSGDDYKVESVELADGTTLDLSQIEIDVQTVTGTESNDYLYGYETNDTLIGNAGSDQLYAGAGEDQLLGGDGKDNLYGQAGNDELDGEAGNDYLVGGEGDDIYRWGRSDGNDTISDYDSTDRNNASNVDRLIFDEGISLSDLSWSRSNNDLVFTINDTGETIRISSYFSGDDYKVESVELADGTALDLAQIEVDVRTVVDTASNDYLYGYETEDTLNGNGGHDQLYAGSGNDQLFGVDGSDSLYAQNGDDLLNGGAGNDYLIGGNGSDTYLFTGDSGSDTISNYDTNAASVDTANFDSTSVEDLWFSRSGNDLRITVAGTDNQVTISSWYSGSNYQLDRIETGSSVLLNNQVDQLVNAMAAYDVPLGAGNVVPQNVQDELQTTLVETWQTA